MDEKDPRTESDRHTEHLARYGAPIPPPPKQGQPSAPTAPPVPPRRRGARWAAAGTALAVLAVAGGAGFALGRLGDHGSTAGAPNTGYAGQAPQQGQEQPNSGTDPFAGTPFAGPGGSDGDGGPDGGGDGGGDGGANGGFGTSPFESSDTGTPATASQLTGLVRIASTLKYQNGRAAGTGMILTSTGEVVTNHHVVEGSTRLRVTVMSTGRTYPATVVGTDAKDDVAVLQLQGASGLQTVTPDSDPIAVGDDVTAVGDANGDTATFTAAKGAIVATGQNITTSSEGGRSGERLRGLIKISSDVISGDSGGATYDGEGEVLGMTTAASTGTSDVVGFAIPIAKVIRIAGDLESGTQGARYAYGSPAFLGIGLGGTSSRVGVVYDGTPAARAGLVAGDTITRVGTTRVQTAAQLRRAVTAYSPGDQVRLTWTDTTGTAHIATVTLAAGPVA